MGKISAPRKVFNFKIAILGFNEYEAQSVELPDVEIEATEHGDTNYDIKTAGRVKIGDLKIEKLSPLPVPDNHFHAWLVQCQSTLLGGGALPLTYKQIMTITEMDTTGLIPINTWTLEGVWPKKITGMKFDRMSSDNVIEKIEFSVDRIYKI